MGWGRGPSERRPHVFWDAAVGREGWRSFAQDNDTPALAEAAAVVGRPLLNFIHGGAVRRAYEGCLEALRSGRRRALSFEFSCDSPALARRMRLCISTVQEGAAPGGFLFQSIAAATYYRHGGSSAVRISHGICSRCMKERVEPLLA